MEVYNSHGGTINLVIDAFGYFTSSGPTMVSATVTDTTIAITYNEAVSCPSLAWRRRRLRVLLDWRSVRDYVVQRHRVVGDVLTLTGVFTLPGTTGRSIVLHHSYDEQLDGIGVRHRPGLMRQRRHLR